MKKVVIIFGTRPEAIKLAPLIHELKQHREFFELRICVTAQHREMLDQMLKIFGIEPDHDLDIMSANQSLPQLSASMMTGVSDYLAAEGPDLVLVQGDTTTSSIAAQAAYYRKIPVGHVEAGLRSGNKYRPFPEEINRRICSTIASFHFCPTERSRENLLREGHEASSLFVTGNTIVDALQYMRRQIDRQGDGRFVTKFSAIDLSRKTILLTCHRRESFGEEFRHICEAVRQIAVNHPGVNIVYPVHLNPNVRKRVYTVLDDVANIYLLDPLDYRDFVWLMSRSYLILTDSGGIQEEAPSLGKPLLIMRTVTERTEAVEAGIARLVGTSTEAIVNETRAILNSPQLYRQMAGKENPFGDGQAAKRIVSILNNAL